MKTRNISTRYVASMLFAMAIASSPLARAQESVEVTIGENGTSHQETIDLPKSMTYPLDSLLNDWKAKNYIDLGKDCETSLENPQSTTIWVSPRTTV